jgi:hypothetical protein
LTISGQEAGLDAFQKRTLMKEPHIAPENDRETHSSIQMTLDVYSHVAPGLQEAAALRFDDLMVPKRETESAAKVGWQKVGKMHLCLVVKDRIYVQNWPTSGEWNQTARTVHGAQLASTSWFWRSLGLSGIAPANGLDLERAAVQTADR